MPTGRDRMTELDRMIELDRMAELDKSRLVVGTGRWFAS